MWDNQKEKLFRSEVERRYRERVPPKNVLDVSGVGRGEMRGWAREHCGELPPEVDIDWSERFSRWYRRMTLRVQKEQGDEFSYQRLVRHYRRTPVRLS